MLAVFLTVSNKRAFRKGFFSFKSFERTAFQVWEALLQIAENVQKIESIIKFSPRKITF